MGNPTYRAPLRSRRDEIPEGLAIDRALTLGLCGFGGRLDRSPTDLEDALTATDLLYGERAARRLRRFAEVPDGAFVWTREPDGLYHLGRLTGPWRYDSDPAALAADLVHIRDCEWSPEPFPETAVPTGTAYTFSRGGRNFQRIRDAATEVQSEKLWKALQG